MKQRIPKAIYNKEFREQAVKQAKEDGLSAMEVARLARLPIAADDGTPATRQDQVMGLAREHGLTAYDATYLDLALRMNAVLATFDGKLAGAMQDAGGALFT